MTICSRNKDSSQIGAKIVDFNWRVCRKRFSNLLFNFRIARILRVVKIIRVLRAVVQYKKAVRKEQKRDKDKQRQSEIKAEYKKKSTFSAYKGIATASTGIRPSMFSKDQSKLIISNRNYWF